MRQGDEARRQAGRLDRVAHRVFEFDTFRKSPPKPGEMIILRIAADQKDRLPSAASGEQTVMPGCGAFLARRQIAAGGIMPGKQKPIGAMAIRATS